MKPYEAYGLMIPRGRTGSAKAHALALGCSESLVNQWRRPHEHEDFDTGKRSPIERVIITMRTALGLQVPERDALAGLHCLAQAFNHVCVPIPMPDADVADQIKDLLKASKEIGDWMAETSKALDDGVLKESERARICKEGYEAIAGIMASLMHSKPEGE